MWQRWVVLGLVAAYVGHRLDLAWEVARARRTGNTARVEALQRRGRNVLWTMVGLVALGAVLLTALVWLNSR